MAKTYSIAIDGPAGAGKSTIAKRLGLTPEEVVAMEAAALAKMRNN